MHRAVLVKTAAGMLQHTYFKGIFDLPSLYSTSFPKEIELIETVHKSIFTLPEHEERQWVVSYMFRDRHSK